MTEVLYKGICAYGRGFHGPVQLYIDDAKTLVLMVGNKWAWSSSLIEPRREPTDATGWAEAAFDPPAADIYAGVAAAAKEWNARNRAERESSGGRWRYDELRWRKDNK